VHPRTTVHALEISWRFPPGWLKLIHDQQNTFKLGPGTLEVTLPAFAL
jgi:hypothetical protein